MFPLNQQYSKWKIGTIEGKFYRIDINLFAMQMLYVRINFQKLIFQFLEIFLYFTLKIDTSCEYSEDHYIGQQLLIIQKTSHERF